MIRSDESVIHRQNRKHLQEISQYHRNLIHLLLYVAGGIYAAFCFFLWRGQKATINAYLVTVLMQFAVCQIKYISIARVNTSHASPQYLADGLLLLPVSRMDIIGWHFMEVVKTQFVFEGLLGIIFLLVQKPPAWTDLIWIILIVGIPLAVVMIRDRKLFLPDEKME